MTNHILRGLIFHSCFLLMYMTDICFAEHSGAVGPPVTISKPLTTTSSVVETANGSPLYFSETQTPKGDQLSSTAGASNHNSVVPPGSQTSTRAGIPQQSTVTQDSAKTVQQENTEMHTPYFTTSTLSGLFSTHGAQGPPTSSPPDSATSKEQTTSEIASRSYKSSGSSSTSGFTVSNQSLSGSGPPTFIPPTLVGPQGPINLSKTYGPPAIGPTATTLVHNENSKNSSYTSRTTQIMNVPVTTASRSWIDRPYLFIENFDLVGFIKGICPYTKSCRQGDESDTIETYESCCSKCDCSDDCFAKGNCCYDKEMPMQMNKQKTPTSSLNESCVFPTYGQSSIQELMNFNKKSVLMIDHCPEKKDTHGQSNNQASSDSSCEHSELTGILSILDLAPVYSSENFVSYSNQHCALCNAATKSLVPWNRITLTCHGILFFMHLFKFSTSIESFLQNLKLTGCIIEFLPPHDDSVKCLHQKAIISDCYDTLAVFVNPKIIDYCKNVTIPFGRDGKIYNNLFCFGCNEFKPDIYEFACENNMYGYGYEFEKPEAEIDVIALESLLVDLQNRSEKILDKMCDGEEGFIYNQYLNQCLTYTCAPSKVNVSGQCLSVLKNLKNVGLDYKVTYRFLVGTVNSEKYLYEDETTKMTTNDSIATLCRRNTKTTASLRDYHVTYDTLMSRVVTELTNIEKEFSDFKQRYESLVNRSEKLELTLDHGGYEALPLGQIDFVRFKDAEAINECPESIAMVDLQFCDAVMFRINSDQRDSEGTLRINTIDFKPSEYLVRLQPVNDSMLMYAQICKDLFREKLETMEDNEIEITSSTIVTSPRTTLMLIYILVSFIIKS